MGKNEEADKQKTKTKQIKKGKKEKKMKDIKFRNNRISVLV
jgi:hypothetical protein